MITGEKQSRRKISIVIIVIASICLVGVISVSAYAVTRKPYAKQQTSSKNTPSLGFYMTTNNDKPKVGDQFDIKLYANTADKKVKTVSAMLTYDPAHVSIVAASAAPKADPLANPPIEGFDLTLACGPTNGCRKDNQVAFALANTGDRLNGGRAVYIGTVRLKALKAGSTSITYTPEIQQTGFLNPDQNVQQALNMRQIQNTSIEIRK